MFDTSGLAALALAFALSSVIGLERELRRKDAGLRTNTLVGVGAALFTLAGRYGFGDAQVEDPSRIAAQVASGIGFIGAGVIFLRRDVVRGLTTAAAIWLTAAVGLAAGAGVPLLAIGATATHLVVAYVYTPLIRLLPTSKYAISSLEVSYREGKGVLRNVLAATTDLGFVVTNLDVARRDPSSDLVSVSLDAEGKPHAHELVDALQRVDGVLEVRAVEGVD
jgi:putative Mg2+ transporter-C (MgtC) family protein